MRDKILPIKRKTSVYLDLDLQAAISRELEELWANGYLDISAGDLIKRRLRESYGIPGVKANVKG